ncbi:MAG: hypothetical protein ABSH50_03235 [Bryobacteraceae bacterium]|jgi:hypothetical protein
MRKPLLALGLSGLLAAETLGHRSTHNQQPHTERDVTVVDVCEAPAITNSAGTPSDKDTLWAFRYAHSSLSGTGRGLDGPTSASPGEPITLQRI